MKLVLDLPEGWSVRAGQGNGWTAALGNGGNPIVTLRASALVTRPDNMRAWAGQIASGDMLPNTSLRTDHEEDTKTALQWPLHILLSSVVASDGAVMQRRLFAFYTFLDYAAYAIASGPHAQFNPHVDTLQTALRSGRADMSRDEVVSLYELWR